MFLGFNYFQSLLPKIVFYIYFGVLQGHFFSAKVKTLLEINKSKLLRFLQTYEVDCTFEEETYNYLSYSCEVPIKIDKLNNLKIRKEFRFSSIPPNTTIIISPLIESFMDNILEENKFYDLFNQKLSLYILEKSQINEFENQNFKLSGIIYDRQPNFKKINFILIAKAEIKGEETNGELNCTVINIINNNYTLNCQGNKDITYNLNYSSAFIDDEILLLKFDENQNATINMENSKTSKKLFFKGREKQNNGLIIIVIVVIFIAIIAVLASMMVIIIRWKKQKQKNVINLESTILKIKN